MQSEVAVKRATLLSVALVAAYAALHSAAQTANPATHGRDAAIALEQQGDNAGAEAAWRALLQAHPSSAEACAHLGLLEARQEHYSEAVTLYRKALALNPAMPGLRLNLGLSLFKSGALRAAIDAFVPLLKAEPAASPEAQRLNTLVAMAHYGLGEYAAAIPYLRKVTASDPQNLPYRLVLAHSCLWSKQYPCVLDVYRQILTLNAESAEADMLAGEALDEMQDKAGATEQFRAAVKANPREPDVHFGLGYLLWAQNQFDEAAQEFQAELSNSPDHAEAMTFLADCEIQLSRPEDARPLLQKALGIDPKLERALLDMGILDAQAGRKEEALREFKTAEQLVPTDVNVHWRLARLYQSMGKKAEAQAEFDKTSSLHKAANDTIFEKLHEAQAKGKAEASADGSRQKQSQ
jgi:tetratricopeptide (TPR) repeat protein